MKKIFILMTALTLMLLTACSNAKKVTTLKAQQGVALYDVEITNVYPTRVMEGTLMYIEGHNFGIAPTAITIGDTQITEFLSWDQDLIFFRAPKGLTSGDVTVGDSQEVFEVEVLAQGTKVTWNIDMAKVDEYLTNNYAEYGLGNAPRVEGQLFIKGQWDKMTGTFSDSWDEGNKVRMFLTEDGIYTSEMILTEKNLISYEKGYMLFAFEDENQEDKSLSKYESNSAYMLKKYLAATDDLTDIDSDPALVIDPEQEQITFEIK